MCLNGTIVEKISQRGFPHKGFISAVLFTNDKGTPLERYGEEKEEDGEDNDYANNNDNDKEKDLSQHFFLQMIRGHHSLVSNLAI